MLQEIPQISEYIFFQNWLAGLPIFSAEQSYILRECHHAWRMRIAVSGECIILHECAVKSRFDSDMSAQCADEEHFDRLRRSSCSES